MLTGNQPVSLFASKLHMQIIYVLVSVLKIIFFLFYDVNLTTQDFVYLKFVKYQMGLRRNMPGLAKCNVYIYTIQLFCIHTCRPRWLSWMRRPTGNQEVAGSTPVEVGNILSCRLIMKYFQTSFSPFRFFKKCSCQFLAKKCAQYWLTA